MKKKSLIYVAGHTGLIGSAILRKLKLSGFGSIITRTHKQLDLADQKKVNNLFEKEKPEYIFLAAGRVGGILANNRYPAEFIYQNTMIQANLIDLSYRFGVKKLLFLASSCIYPKYCHQPMKETYLLTGAIEQTNEPFAIAKISGIKMCQAYNRQYGTNFIPVIPANIYGINDHLTGDAHVISSLMRKFYEAKFYKKKYVQIWGSGRPKRDFLYVDDLADACLFLMNHYSKNEIINVGTGIETSIKDLTDLIADISVFKGKAIYDKTKPDGNPRRFLDTSRIRRLGWKPSVSIDEGLNLTYNWFKKHYNVKDK